jgi:hypothetical protein
MSEGSKAIDEGQDAAKTNHENLDAEKAAVINQRLLKESQEYKEKYKRTLAEKDELEAKKLQESGDIAAQLEAEKRKSLAAMQELGKTKKKVISQVIKDKIQRIAGDVHNIDDLLSRPKLKEYLKSGLDEDNLDVADDSIKLFVEDTKKEAPYFWKAQGPIGANTSRPSSTGTSASVDTNKMSAAELKAYIASTFK